MEHTAVETQIGRLSRELQIRFDGFDHDVVEATLRAALGDLQGSVLPGDLPEMASRLVAARLAPLVPA